MYLRQSQSGINPKRPKEASIQSPTKRDLADWSHDKRKDNYHRTGDHSKLDHPGVSDWVAISPYECDSYNQMGKGQPVGPISHEWIIGVGLNETLLNFEQPPAEYRRLAVWADDKKPVKVLSSVSNGIAVRPLMTRAQMKKTKRRRIFR